MTNELHLDEFRILDVKKDEYGSMLYLVEPDGEETSCLNCGSINTVCNGTLTRHGTLQVSLSGSTCSDATDSFRNGEKNIFFFCSLHPRDLSIEAIK